MKALLWIISVPEFSQNLTKRTIKNSLESWNIIPFLENLCNLWNCCWALVIRAPVNHKEVFNSNSCNSKIHKIQKKYCFSNYSWSLTLVLLELSVSNNSNDSLLFWTLITWKMLFFCKDPNCSWVQLRIFNWMIVITTPGNFRFRFNLWQKLLGKLKMEKSPLILIQSLILICVSSHYLMTLKWVLQHSKYEQIH